jgi:hypothetical protein
LLHTGGKSFGRRYTDFAFLCELIAQLLSRLAAHELDKQITGLFDAQSASIWRHSTGIMQPGLKLSWRKRPAGRCRRSSG